MDDAGSTPVSRSTRPSKLLGLLFLSEEMVMKAVVGDVIGTKDGRYGTVRSKFRGVLSVESLPVLDVTEMEVVGHGEVFEIAQSEVASIR